MSTCTHCGQYYKPKYRTMKLCFDCWKKRETAFKNYDGLLLELHELRCIAGQSQHGEAIPAEKIRKLLSLCHPDKWDGSPKQQTATEITRWLIELKKSA